MAAAAVSITAPATTQRINNPLMNVALIPITIVGSATVYATASGGFPIDLFAFLNSASPSFGPINYKDIQGMIGTSTLGYQVAQFALGTPTATTLPATFRLWNGITESADAANSQTINGWLLVARGGVN